MIARNKGKENKKQAEVKMAKIIKIVKVGC